MFDKRACVFILRASFRGLPRRLPTWDLWSWYTGGHTCADNTFNPKLIYLQMSWSLVVLLMAMMKSFMFGIFGFKCSIVWSGIGWSQKFSPAQESINIQSSPISLPIVFPIKASTLTKHFVFLAKPNSCLIVPLKCGINQDSHELWLCIFAWQKYKIIYCKIHVFSCEAQFVRGLI